MIKVYDNWGSTDTLRLVENTCCSNQMTWHLPTNPWSTVAPYIAENALKKDKRVVDSHQMVHPVVIDGVVQMNSVIAPMMFSFLKDFFDYALPGKLSFVEVARIKVNLMHRQKCSKKVFFNPPHVDVIDEYLKNFPDLFPVVCLYYLQDSDGDTFFFDNKEDLNIIERVTPKAGRMVMFDNDIYHASSPPQKSNARFVINSNVFLPFPVESL